MAHRIVQVQPGSPAARAGISPGDELKAIDGEVIVDFIDYQALTASGNLTVKTDRGEYRIRKREYADLGLVFESPMMSGVRMCCNRCLFCFVEQLPSCARESLRVRDDDWRLSLMTGSYVTLTNMPDRGLDRIIARHASPLYISVHAMNPFLRVRLMGTPRAARLPDQLRRLAEGGIRFHTQVVLCPGLNDGCELERTVSELAAMHPAAISLALVPVGLTGHRDGLPAIEGYTPSQAKAVLRIAKKWQGECLKKLGTRFVFPSDEFYLIAGEELPEDEEYEDYAQIDDGVGMLRLFETEYRQAWEEASFAPVRTASPVIACGSSAAPFFEALLRRFPVPGARARVVPIRNRFFGQSVTVSGLIAGRDLVEQLSGEDCTHVLITRCALREEDGVFLDDMSLKEAQEKLGRPILPVDRQGESLMEVLKNIVEEK